MYYFFQLKDEGKADEGALETSLTSVCLQAIYRIEIFLK